MDYCDWSSDVCSSDLPNRVATTRVEAVARYPSCRHSRPAMTVSRPIGSMLMGQYPTLSRSLDPRDRRAKLGVTNTNLRPRPTRPRQPYLDLRFFRIASPNSMTGQSRGALMPRDWIALPAQLSFWPRRTSVSVSQLDEIFRRSRYPRSVATRSDLALDRTTASLPRLACIHEEMSLGGT